MIIVKSVFVADILKSRTEISEMHDIGSSETSGIPGVNKSRQVTLKDGSKWILKLSKGEHTSRWRAIPAHSQYKRERAGFLVDEALGFCLVPLTKIVKYKGDVGSLQKWVDAESNADLTLEKYSDDTIWKLGILDLVLGQTDRHSKNQLDLNGKVVAIDNGYSQPIKAQPNDPRSVILSRYAYRIWDKEIPDEYLKAISNLKNPSLQKHIRKLVGEEAFSLYNKRVDAMLSSGVAKFPGYRIVQKLRGIPPEKKE